MKQHTEKQLLFRIRFLTVFYMLALLFFGITAFPLQSEIKIVCDIFGIERGVPPESYNGLLQWLAFVQEGIINTNANYPFLAYGTDWLAFSHIAIAFAFIGLYIKPVRNKWVVYFAMAACIGVVPLSLICGIVREIPFYWRLVDMSFSIFGMIPLLGLHVYIKRLETLTGKIISKY